MILGFVHNLDPVLLRLGPFQIRYYGLVFVATLLVGYWVWRRQMLRGGHPRALADRFLIWGTIATLAGARLGHCLFYEPERFLNDPISILFFWQGGLASHGATIGLILALFLFARRNRLPVLEMMDRFAMSAAIGSAGIRLGNFLNSEIVGRATSVPWAVRFMHYDNGAIARHPSQLYEFALGLLVLLILYLADRWAGKEQRPLGLMTGLFLTMYFAGRFIVEFFKEFQTPWESALTMGQILSIPPFLAGIAVLAWVYRTRCRLLSDQCSLIRSPRSNHHGHDGAPCQRTRHMMIEGKFKDVRFEIGPREGDWYFTRFDLASDHLCQCTRKLLVSSVLGKTLRTLHLGAVAFALGPGYESFPDYVQRLASGEKQAAALGADGEAASEPSPMARRL